MRARESVWEYPRPPALEPVRERLRVEYAGEVIADTTAAYRVLETSHPPTYYLPPESVRPDLLERNGRTSHCEWKGRAEYFDIVVNGRASEGAAWRYPEIDGRYAAISGYYSFYASRVDACWVGDERVAAQEGDFYGGWITANIVGPFKGGPGTAGW